VLVHKNSQTTGNLVFLTCFEILVELTR